MDTTKEIQVRPEEPTQEAQPKDLAPVSQKSIYDGLAAEPFSKTAIAILTEKVDEDMLDILPTGEVYLSQVHYRRRLNEAFGPGGWGVRPIGPVAMKDNHIMREYALFVNGRFVAQAAGEADYIPNNPRMSYATATEACKSNAIMRLCKDIGIASECWDRRFTENFKKERCVQVKRSGKYRNPYQWRLKDAEPFFDEAQEGEKENSTTAPDQAASEEEGQFIASKFPGKCRSCQKPFDKGAQVYWIAGIKGVQCQDCAGSEDDANLF